MGLLVILAVPFLSNNIGIMISYLINSLGKNDGKEIANAIVFLLFSSFVLLTQIACICKGIAQSHRYLSVMIHGKNITGEISGCKEDDSSNRKKNKYRKPYITYIIRIDTSDGYRIIEYKMSCTNQKYTVGDTVKLKVYKNYAKICGLADTKGIEI